MKHLVKMALAALFALPCSAFAENRSVSSSSPGGNIKATVYLTDGRLSYTVEKDGRVVVKDSPLGLKTSGADLTEGLDFVSTATAETDTPYWLPVGKQLHYRDHCNTLSVVTAKDDCRLTVEFRLYDDGFAFRYGIPEHGGNKSVTLTEEASRIRLGNFRSCLACKFRGNIQDPNYPYEGHYNLYGTWNTLTAADDTRFNSPTLVYDGTDYMLISEANNNGAFCTSLTKAEKDAGEFSFVWTGQTKDFKEDKAHQIVCSLPFLSPWRMAVTGSLATVFETTMAENLCPPTAIRDMDWIKPGVSAWYWGGSDGNKKETRDIYGGSKEGEYAHAGLAADMGWRYTLIDGGWSADWVPGLVKDAKEKGVESLLWWTAKLSDSQDFSNANMAYTLKKWRDWGVKGIKIDFWEDDSKETMERMEKLLKVAGGFKMLVNLHGCTRPSGMRRTYPHLMTQEGIYGGENNFWAAGNLSAAHHINLALTRNVVGAADYTPGDFATWRGSLITNHSVAHHMALLTVFESSIVHIAECPENIRHFQGKDIMKRLPTVWDESHMLEGQPGKYITIARRNGEDWWIAGINAAARVCKINFDFLDEGKTYYAYIYRDATCRTDMKFQKTEVSKGTAMTVKEISEGGFLMQVSTDGNLDCPAERDTYEAEATWNTLSSGVTRQPYSNLHASGSSYVMNLGLGRYLKFNNVKAEKDGNYLLTLYYMTQDTRKAKVLVNGEQAGDTVTFHGNGDITNTYNPEGMGWNMIPVRLQAGNNTITVQSYDDSWAPNFDRITIHPLDNGTAISLPQSSAAAAQTADTFDLMGRKLNAAPGNSVYIKGGKKFLSRK